MLSFALRSGTLPLLLNQRACGRTLVLSYPENFSLTLRNLYSMMGSSTSNMYFYMYLVAEVFTPLSIAKEAISMSSQPSSSVTPVTQSKSRATTNGRKWRVLVVVLVIISGLLTSAYAALSLYIATQLVYVAQKPL